MKQLSQCSDQVEQETPFMGACARNIWYVNALSDMDIQYVHIRGLYNTVADLLSRWTDSHKDVTELYASV